MNKLLFLATLAAFTVNAEIISGPIGDTWDNKHILTIKKNDSPLYLSSETFLRAEKIVIDRSIVTNGFGLTIEARELVISPDVEIKTFDRPYTPQTFVNTTLKYTTSSNSCSLSGTATHEVGIDGPTGEPGLDVSSKPHDIKVFATFINGKLNISADGQQGGKGGQGGIGGKGLDGCQGRNANASCSGFGGWGSGKSHDGENGKNGARGGYGGQGGIGGRGGENGNIYLAFLKIQSPQELLLSSLAGKYGEGGEPGENGLSGKGGPGGNGDQKECGTWPSKKTIRAKAGKPGKVMTLVESLEERERRRGLTGESGLQNEDAIKVKGFEELKSEREAVISTVMDFHFSRVFYQLIQQSILIVINQQDLLSDFSEINEMAKRKLIRDWQEGLIQPLEKEKRLNNNLRELLVISKELIDVLTNMTRDQSELVRGKVSALLKKQRASLNQKVKRIAASCRSFISIDSRELENKTELFTIPLCNELQELTNNPMAQLVLSKAVTLALAGLNKDDYSFGELDTSSRAPGSQFEIIVIKNRKFGVEHFKGLYSIHERGSGTWGALRSLSPLNLPEITVNNLGAYARMLKEGMR